MGWKSTTNLCRAEAIALIHARALAMTNSELEDALVSMGYGDDPKLGYHGFDFIVNDTREQAEAEDTWPDGD